MPKGQLHIIQSTVVAERNYIGLRAIGIEMPLAYCKRIPLDSQRITLEVFYHQEKTEPMATAYGVYIQSVCCDE